MHFAHHPPNPATGKDGAAALPGTDHPPAPLYPPPAMSDHPHPYVHDPSQPPPANDFRARFHRQLTAPSPFRTGIVPPDSQAQSVSSSTAASASTSGSVQNTGDGMDPNASSSTSTSGEQRSGQLGGLTIDPQLGQARDEAVGVAGKLER